MPVTLCPSNNLDVLDTVTVASLLVILDENVSEETPNSRIYVLSLSLKKGIKLAVASLASPM